MILYICQDGEGPSGVATYGYSVLQHRQDAQMLLLNANEVPISAEKKVHNRITTLIESKSHNPIYVAHTIHKLIMTAKTPVTLLPNTGDTPWVSVSELLKMYPVGDRQRIRILGIVHSNVPTQYELAERYLPIAPSWIGVSQRCFDELQKRLVLREGHIYKLTYPIQVMTAVRRPNFVDSIRLAYVGRLEESQKRISRLVHVLSKLRNRGVNYQCTIVGDGPATRGFSEALKAAGEGVCECVTMTGALDRKSIDAVLRSQDVMLLVSAYEGLPFSLLEAMAAGVCPVAMAMNSGLSDLIKDGVEGRIVAQGDINAMVDVLAELSQDRLKVFQLGVAAKKKVSRCFSCKTHFDRLDSIFEELHNLPVPDPMHLRPDPTDAYVSSIVQKAISERSPVAIYGAGMFGRKVVDACLLAGVKIIGFFDSDPARTGTVYRDLRCRSLQDVIQFQNAIFIAASLQFGREIKRIIKSRFIMTGLSCPMVITANE